MEVFIIETANIPVESVLGTFRFFKRVSSRLFFRNSTVTSFLLLLISCQHEKILLSKFISISLGFTSMTGKKWKKKLEDERTSTSLPLFLKVWILPLALISCDAMIDSLIKTRWNIDTFSQLSDYISTLWSTRNIEIWTTLRFLTNTSISPWWPTEASSNVKKLN